MDSRFGPIWNTDAGDGRWRFILRNHLPPLAGARVLDLGANNGFNAIQMLRSGAHEVIAIERDERAIRQGGFVKDLSSGRMIVGTCSRTCTTVWSGSPEMDLGSFNIATALCSLYYLEDAAIADVVRHVSTIADTMVLQCNTDRGVHRSDPRTFEKASIEYALEVLRRNGFPSTQVVAPGGYPRPLVIGCVGDRGAPPLRSMVDRRSTSRPTPEARVTHT